MNPFENLIKELGQKVNRPLTVDAHQSCCLKIKDDLLVQIDLDSSGNKILIGTVLAALQAGSYRDALLKQAMCVNGTSIIPRGILAYSEKNESLVLFQSFDLAYIQSDSLLQFLKLFITHARVWKEALARGDIPQLEQEVIS